MNDDNEEFKQQDAVEEQPAVEEIAEEQPVEEQPAEEQSSTELTVMQSQELVASDDNVQSEEKMSTSIQLKKIDSGSIVDALKCMISFFTIIRLDVGEKEMDAMERNFWLAPALGFINGLVAFIVLLVLGITLGIDDILMSILALATVFLFSKFLHFDGLVDFGDGMVVSSDRQEDHVRALKDSLIGAGGFGVALIVVLISIACLNDISANFVTAWASEDYPILIAVAFLIFPLEILIKNTQVVTAAFGKPGNGMAAKQVANTDVGDVVFSTILTTILVIVASLICLGVASACPFHTDIEPATVILLGLVAGITSIAVGVCMAFISNKTFGFVNGDVLGAANEISRAVILLISLSLLILSAW